MGVILSMTLDLDFELRLAVFDHLRRLSDAGGGYVSARTLNEGLTFHGGRVPIWNQQKGIFRPAILRHFGAALSIQTAYDGPYDDHDDRVNNRVVYKYRGTDPQHPDNVAVRRAMDLGRPLLYLVGVAWSVDVLVAVAKHAHLLFQRPGKVVDLRIAGSAGLHVSHKFSAAEQRVRWQREIGCQRQAESPSDRPLRSPSRDRGMDGSGDANDVAQSRNDADDFQIGDVDHRAVARLDAG